MVFINKEVIEYLNNCFNGKVKVKNAYDVSKLETPLITIDEQVSCNDRIETGRGLPRYSENKFIFEFYVSDEERDGNIISKTEVLKELIEKTNKFIQEHFLFSLTGDINIAPYNDKTILRAVARYSGKIDVVTGVIYK